MKANTIRAKRTAEVWLRVGPLFWSRLPVDLRGAVLVGLERIAAIRADIAATAKVSSMPFVEVLCELWRSNSGTVQGAARPLRLHGRVFIGAQFPIITALCEDQDIVRALLVHEFSHCFHFIARLINQLDSSGGVARALTDESYDIEDAAADSERMVEADAWFSDSDANSFIFHSDTRLDVVDQRINELEQIFPLIHIDPEFKITGRFSFPDDLVNHVRKLNGIAETHNMQGGRVA